MRASYYESNGPARTVLRLADVETPEPGRGEVRVRLRASGVNPSDVKSRAGLTRKIAFPRVIPHSDGAGEIDRVGEGVAPARVGERVWVWNGQWRRAFGTAAEFITVPAQQAVPLPANITMEAGACLGIPAYTGYQAVVLAGIGEGSTVLIAAGAGAVGHYAIQLAKKRKATVITTVSSPAKAEIARQAGADHAIDYKRENVGERVMAITAKHGVDAVIEMDLAANARLLPDVLAPNGTVAIYGSGAPEVALASEASGQRDASTLPAPDTRPEPGSSARASIPFQFLLQNSIALKFFLVYLMPAELRERATADITRMLERGELIHNVAQTFDLGDLAAAHEAVEAGKAMGNIVVRIG
jgi:NADPH2:quinone reductase